MKRASKEPTISIRDIKQRISAGDLEAERLMGLILLDGTGVKKNVNEGFRLLRSSAERGDSTSECDVGFCFHTGQGTDFNCYEALRYYKLSADHSNAKGHNNLGYCLFNGEGTRADQNQAAMHFKISSDNNCPEGICNYARCLEYGDGVPQDLTKAATLYKKAAEMNNPHAMYCYGRCLTNGIGVSKNDQLAVEYFRQAAVHHDEYGQLYYHLMLFKGRGVERDEVTAATYFQREALAGNPHAQTYYGIALETGRGVPKVDVNKAAMQYRMAANNGDPHGQFCLGLLFRDGKGVSKSESEAAKLFKMSADNGYGRGMLVFADCLNDGVGVNVFKPGAVSYYKAAADKGKAVGQYKYGAFIEEGKYVEKNMSLAAHYYKMAADQHYGEAEYALGRLHEKGDGVKQDYEMAAGLYKRAADQRIAGAEDRYGKCLQRGRGTLKSPVMAIDFFRRSASQKLAAGQFHLGRTFETGLGVPSGPDLSVAINNYKLAAAQNNQQALYHLGLLNLHGARSGTAAASAKYGKESLRAYEYPYGPMANFSDFLKGKKIESNGSADEGRVVLEKDEVEAVSLFRKAALLGHTKSLFEYGLCLLRGVGINKDIEDAKKQFKLAAANCHAESMFVLGLIAREVDKDEAAAMQWFRDAAGQGHAVAQCELGKILYSQENADAEPEMVDMFARSAASGYADGQYWLGRLLEEGHEIHGGAGISTEKAPGIAQVLSASSALAVEQKAFACFSLASKQQHALATTRSGLYTLRGLGTEMNGAAALDLFEKAAKLGDAHALFLLGRCHEFGDGTSGDSPGIPATKSTITTTAVAAEKPSQMKAITKVKSNANISMSPQTPSKGQQPTQRNPRLAHLSPSSNQSSASSSSLGARPPTGSTPLPPMKDWVKYYERAAEAKDPCALYALGLLYARNVISVTPPQNPPASTQNQPTSTQNQPTSTQNQQNQAGAKGASPPNQGGADERVTWSGRASEANMERAAALFAESASLGSACGKMCYSCCIARAEGGVERDMDLAFGLANESLAAGIHWTRLGRSPCEFEDETSFTRLLRRAKSSSPSAPDAPKKAKDPNELANDAEPLDDEKAAALEAAAKKGHQGAMFVLAPRERDANEQQAERRLAEAAPWLERQVKAAHQEVKKRRPSLKKIQMTKKSITSHHKALIQKPDGKHTFIVV